MTHRSLALASGAVELYGSFHLAGAELALPVAALQEVVNHPAALTPVPLGPSYLLGLFNLRGTLIPVVDLRQLLCLQADSGGAPPKIAIVEVGDVRVGLQFDATGEILRVPQEQVIAVDLPDTGTAAPISAVLKLDDGERILQVLSPAALLGLRDVPHLAASTRRTNAARVQQSQRRQNVSFRVGTTLLALPMDAIQEIIRVPALQHSPFADEICIGLLNLRGATIPVVDFGRFLGFAGNAFTTTPDSDERRIVVLQRGDQHFGLLVDEVSSIVAYREDELLAMPSYGVLQRSLFAGYLGGDGSAGVLLINAESLFVHERIALLAQGHRDLYRNALGQGAAARANGVATRQTFVTFRIGHLLGVRIGELREVIDYRDDVVKTPGLPAFVRGVLNLRGGLVTVIDVRAMYAMSGYEDLSHAKMLIVEHRAEKYGLLVDTVEDIVTLNGGARLAMPAIFTRDAGISARNDMREAIELPGQGTLMLLDPASLCERVAQQVALAA